MSNEDDGSGDSTAEDAATTEAGSTESGATESEAESAGGDLGGSVDYAGQCAATCPDCTSRCVRGAQHLADTLKHYDGTHNWI